MVFYHYYNGSLVNGQASVGIPVLLFAESVRESVFAPDLISYFIVKIFQGLHRIFRCIGKGGERRAWGNDPFVVSGKMCMVSVIVIAGCEPPAVRSIALKSMRIADAMFPVYQRVPDILLPIIGIPIPQA